MSSSSRSTRAWFALSLAASTLAQSTAPTPGQPSRNDAPLGQFEIVGNSVASAQQVSVLS